MDKELRDEGEREGKRDIKNKTLTKMSKTRHEDVRAERERGK
jgi:hypothetical protein